MSEDQSPKPVPVPVGPGVTMKVHRHCADGSCEERDIQVRRGDLSSNWFKVKVREDGHMDLYKADPVKEPELRGAPQLCGMADHAKAEGWHWGPAPRPERKPKSPKSADPKPAAK